MGKKTSRVYKPFNIKEEPAYLPRIGNQLRMSGILFQGEGDSILFMLPSSRTQYLHDFTLTDVERPMAEEWVEILKRSDDPVYQVDNLKPWLRKAQRAISGYVQQQIWARDNFQCMYCGVKMGEGLLTVDHFIPLELGGDDDPSNYLTLCRKCNKDKGSIHPEKYFGNDYQKLKEYLTQKK